MYLESRRFLKVLNTVIKYKFESNVTFTALVVSAIFLPLYYNTDINIIFKILIYIIPAWLLITIDTNSMVVYDNSISYTKYASPFTKHYNIPLSDIEQVFVSRITMSSRQPNLVIYSKSLQKNFRATIPRGIDEDLCIFFVDNKINVETNNNELDNFILHHINNKRRKKST